MSKSVKWKSNNRKNEPNPQFSNGPKKHKQQLMAMENSNDNAVCECMFEKNKINQKYKQTKHKSNGINIYGKSFDTVLYLDLKYHDLCSVGTTFSALIPRNYSFDINKLLLIQNLLDSVRIGNRNKFTTWECFFFLVRSFVHFRHNELSLGVQCAHTGTPKEGQIMRMNHIELNWIGFRDRGRGRGKRRSSRS